MTNIKDVAERAGVSVTTVSRVTNNRGYIGKETRKKVEKAMKELDYQPNQIARALQNSQTSLIGVIVPDTNHPFFSEVIKNIELYASQNDYKVLICNSLDDHEKESNYISMLKQNRVEGIIMCSQTLNISEYKKVKLPIVTFDRIISEDIPYVSSDNFLGGEYATKHLIDQGCESLLHISGPLDLDMLSNRRGNAFSLICKNNKITHKIIQEGYNHFSYEDHLNFITEHISQHLPNYDGVFCSNDITAYALYNFATENGYKVPDDLKIVGYDYHYFTRMIQIPRLTTIHQSAEKIGKALCSTIIKLIKKEGIDSVNNTIIDVKLKKGDTT